MQRDNLLSNAALLYLISSRRLWSIYRRHICQHSHALIYILSTTTEQIKSCYSRLLLSFPTFTWAIAKFQGVKHIFCLVASCSDHHKFTDQLVSTQFLAWTSSSHLSLLNKSLQGNFVRIHLLTKMVKLICLIYQILTQFFTP